MTPAPMRAVDCQPVDILKLADDLVKHGYLEADHVQRLRS